MSKVQTISPTLARRLAIMRQHLAGPRPSAESKGIMEVIRDLGYVQIDPVRVVERSHLLVLWSRLGRYDPVHLDKLPVEGEETLSRLGSSHLDSFDRRLPNLQGAKAHFCHWRRPLGKANSQLGKKEQKSLQ